MTIFQPRHDNISTYTISKEKLLKWADEVLAPTAQLAYIGKGEFKAGDHCQFCKVKATCRKRAEYNLELAKYDFEMPATLDNIEIAAILAKVDEMISWGNDIKDIPVSTAELPSISTLSTATATRGLLAVSIISRRFETVSLLEASPELKMTSLLMKKKISLTNQT